MHLRYVQLALVRPVVLEADSEQCQINNGEPLHANNNQVKLDGQDATGRANWAAYARSDTIVGFAGLSSIENCPGLSWEEDGTASSSSTNATTKSASFGQPGPVMGVFANPTPNPTPQVTSPLTPVERNLEELYEQYPEKQLHGIPQETIWLVIETFRQVTKDATHAWVRTWCPAMDYDEIVQSMGSRGFEKNDIITNETKTSAQANLPLGERKQAPRRGIADLHRIPRKAVNLKCGIFTIMRLFRRCIIDPAKTLPTPPTEVRRMFDQYIQLCRVLRDGKRTMLLDKTMHRTEVIRGRLEEEQGLRHREAARKIHENNDRYRMQRVLSRNLNLALGGPRLEDVHRSAEERILDEALLDFEQYRSAANTGILEALDVLQIRSA